MSAQVIDIEKTLSELSLDEKCFLLSGVGRCQTQGFEHRGIPSLMMSDGPHGVRTEKFFNQDRATCFPSGTAMGATFDVELMQRVGNLLAEECKSHLVQVLLAPVVCLQRSPLIGRGFEAFGEDPVQSGKLGAAYINGLQELGVASCIKHYTAHDQSDMSIEDNVVMTQRTLREVHTLPFQIAVREANPWALMTAYQKVNGTHASESTELIQEILRRDWKYEGLVLSDWWGVYSTSDALNAGLDLEMPGPSDWRAGILSLAVRSRKVSLETLDASVRRMLTLINQVGPLLGKKEKTSNNTEASRALVRKLTADSVVLLKNENAVLPLSKSSSYRLGLIGDHWHRPAVAGGGSSEPNPYYISKPHDAFVDAFGSENITYSVGCYSHKFSPPMEQNLTQPESQEPGLLLEFFDKDPEVSADAKLHYTTSTAQLQLNFADSLPKGLVPELFFMRATGKFAAEKTMKYRFGLCVAGRARLFIDGKELIDQWTSHPEKTDNTPCFNGFTMERFGEVDMEAQVEYTLSLHLVNEGLGHRVGVAPAGGVRLGGCEVIDENESINRAVALSKDVDVPIIMTGLSSDYEYEGIDRKSLHLPGRVNELIERVLEANPKTVVITEAGTAITMPWIEKAPTVVHSWLGGQETGNAIADVVFGDVNPSGRLPLTFPKRLEDTPAFITFGKQDRTIVYGEGVFVGYRFYEKALRDPYFYFGYGLSYTTFSYSDLVVPPKFDADPEHTMTISVRLANVGKVAGQEVIQVYVSDPESSVQRPKKELKAFKKVFLEPTESKTVNITLDKYALSFWSEEHGQWLAEAGKFVVVIATSADPRSEVLREEFELLQSFKWNGL